MGKVSAPANPSAAIAVTAAARARSEAIRTRRLSKRSLTAPPASRQKIIGTVIATPITASAPGAFQRLNAVHAIAIRKMPSPTSETAIPIQRTRKSREARRGRRSPTRARPPGRSRVSKLGCTRGTPVARLELVLAFLVKVVDECRLSHRPREQESLTELAPQLAERADLLGLLDALCDDLEVEPLADRDDRRGQAGVGVASAEEGAVHLEDVHWESAEIAERGVAGPEVVHRDPHSQVLELVQPRGCRVRVGHHDGLGDLEHERRGLEPRLAPRSEPGLDD